MNWVPVETNNDNSLGLEIDRFQLVTWPFGKWHQIKVFVRYEHKQDPFRPGNKHVGIGLEIAKTLEEAQKRGVAWVENYQKNGPPGPEAIIQESLTNYPDLYESNRDKVLDHLFMTSGNGFEWLDGALVDCDQSPPEDFSHHRNAIRELEESAQRVRDLLTEAGRDIPEEFQPEPPEPPPPPAYHLSSFGALNYVPPDVTREWLQAALEAALLLVNYPEGPEDRQKGQELVEALQGRLQSMA